MSTTGVNKCHWNWTRITNIGLHVVEILVVISIVKFFVQLFGVGAGGVGAGIASIFGNVANFVNGIFDGCSKQQDCSKGVVVVHASTHTFCFVPCQIKSSK